MTRTKWIESHLETQILTQVNLKRVHVWKMMDFS